LYKIPANTLFLGKRLIYMPECHSTNDIAAQILDQPSTQEGTVIITDRQLKGRGQRGNSWITAHHENLTLSIVFKPTFLGPQEQFYLNMAMAIGVHDLIQDKVSDPVFIKWPNDLMVGGNKIGGILIENQLHGRVVNYSIVGIGVNVNQNEFPLFSATSLSRVTGKRYELPILFEELLTRVESHYLNLKQGKLLLLKEAYLNALYWKDEVHTFSDEGGPFEGTIAGVHADGRLCVHVCGHIRYFGLKEIQYQA
jgi:BirA family transcriptional regulator, biotin operon repressor / biotin---[acetyl-CoA-carboxylase] ligase